MENKPQNVYKGICGISDINWSVYVVYAYKKKKVNDLGAFS